MKILYIFFGLAIVVFQLNASSKILSIDKAVEMALKHNPGIDVSRFDFKASKERAAYQKGYYLPRLDLGLGADRQGAKYRLGDNMDSSVLTGTISASQLLYDFGKTSGKIKASSSESKAYEADLNQQISLLILKVKKRYYDVLKTRSIINVDKENIQLQKKHLKRAQQYYKNGIKTVIDVSDAQVRLVEAELKLNNSKYELQLRRALLEEVIGTVPYGGDYQVEHRKLDLSKVSNTLPSVKIPLRQMESFAYEHRYELKSIKHLIDRSGYLVESEKGGYFPSLSLEGDYNRQNMNDEFTNLMPEQQWQAGLKVKWNLFSGLQTDAGVEEAKALKMKVQSRLLEIKLGIKREVVEARLNVRQKKDAVKLLENISATSKKKFYQARKRYENDLSDYVEFQEAQLGYIKSLSNLVVAYYDYYIALAKLDYAIGR